MRSTKYKKLMEYRNRLKQGQSSKFQFQLNNQINTFLQFQPWKQDILIKLESGPSIQTLLDQFFEWIQIPPQMKGKRSNEIAITKSNKYCLKFIKQQDFEVFQRIFQQYINFKQSKKSILVPILGILKMNNIAPKMTWQDYIMFMPNLQVNNSVIYDIKGHCDNRFVNQEDFKLFNFGKDENFVKSSHIQLLLNVQKQEKYKIYGVIKDNIQFLKKLRLIDYSLLLAFSEQASKPEDNHSIFKIGQNHVLQIKIIDLFQVFNEKKKFENKFKSLFFKQVSSVDPDTYAKRMLDFLQKVVFAQK